MSGAKRLLAVKLATIYYLGKKSHPDRCFSNYCSGNASKLQGIEIGRNPDLTLITDSNI